MLVIVSCVLSKHSAPVPVSMQLEIWERQADTVEALMESMERGDRLAQGAIVQSNMGEGKTRVMAPMIVLHFARQQANRKVPRLVFLDALLADAVDHLHRTLTGAAPKPLHFQCRTCVPSVVEWDVCTEAVLVGQYDSHSIRPLL